MDFDPQSVGPAGGWRAVWAGRPRVLAIAAALVVVAGATATVRAVHDAPLDDAIHAFRDGRYEDAAAEFRRVLDADAENVTAYLYLGRIERRRQAYTEAAASLRAAARLAPDDPDVNRELGYLFLDLGRPDPAVRRFDLALEVEPDGDPNWIGLIRALRAARDPRADDVLRRAPDAVRALLATPG